MYVCMFIFYRWPDLGLERLSFGIQELHTWAWKSIGGGEPQHQRSIILGDLKIPPYLSFNSSVCCIKLGMEASGTWL